MPEKLPGNQFQEESPDPTERRSGLSRIVNLDPKQEKAGHELFAALLKDQQFESYEREKTPQEREVIRGILRSIPEFVRAYGGRPIDQLSEANIHLVDETLVPEQRRKALLEDDDVAGLYDFRLQRAVVLPDKRSLLTTAQRTVHEVLHMESFLSFTAEQSPGANQPGKTALHLRRIGFGVFNNEQTKRFFRDLDEAMIEELAARFDARYLPGIPALAEELRRRAAFRNEVALDERNEIAAVVNTKLPDGRWKTEIRDWRYESERHVLRDLIAKIYTANPVRFASEEAVFDLFAKAVFTGKLLEIGHLIEKTLGKGALRSLGEETMLSD
ncbi:MAG: hypothetical protein ACYCOU_20770 [Sulfobacillus sp.]